MPSSSVGLRVVLDLDLFDGGVELVEAAAREGFELGPLVLGFGRGKVPAFPDVDDAVGRELEGGIAEDALLHAVEDRPRDGGKQCVRKRGHALLAEGGGGVQVREGAVLGFDNLPSRSGGVERETAESCQ